MFEIADLNAGYGKLSIIRGVSLEVADGSAVAVFGRNGAGKTTLMHALMGLIRPTAGAVRLDGERIDHLRTEQIVGRGMALVPQARGLFMRQTVEENLELAAYGLHLPSRERSARAAEMFDRFPALGERRSLIAASLSGGEQQMLAIAKALIRQPRFLLLDEPSTGLAPRVVDLLADTVSRLRAEGQSFLITEQNVDWVLGLVDRVCVIDQGLVVEEFAGTDAGDQVAGILARYLGAQREEGRASGS